MADFILGFAAAAAIISIGGGLYEFSVVDPHWPKRLDIIQPARGGINRKMFWIPAHAIFELLLIASLIIWWGETSVRSLLLTAAASHTVMRLWSAFDFVPKAQAFEKADDAPDIEKRARAWSRRSRWRFPLDMTTCSALMLAFWSAAARAPV